MRQVQVTIGSVILLCIGIAQAKDPTQETPLPPVASKALVSVGTMRGTGSGTIFSVQGETTYIVTAEHVVYPQGERGRVVWVYHGRKRVEAKIHTSDAAIDIAIISVTGLEKPEAIKFAEKDFEIGDVAFHYGRATGPQEGKVEKFSNIVIRGKTAVLDIISVQGDSGALTCNVKGELVSVHIGRMWDDKKDIERLPGHGIGVNLETVKRFTAPYMKKD